MCRIQIMSTEYQAYLLRLQRSSANGEWRATMQNAHTGELLRFANKRDLLRHLMQILMEAIDDERMSRKEVHCPQQQVGFSFCDAVDLPAL